MGEGPLPVEVEKSRVKLNVPLPDANGFRR
jgi:hypothetical protein